MFKTILARAVLTVGIAAATVAGVAAAASASQPGVSSPGAATSRPGISKVSFSGTQGSGVASPKITITGSHFGATAPKGTPHHATSCGHFTANGDVFGNKLYFTDDANFEAGFSSSSGADCIGIKVVSWSNKKVVLKFGNAYGTFDHWFLTNGDGYAISIKSAIWGGSVSGLS